MITPLPDLPTGIAQYSRDLLDAVNGDWQVDVFGEPGSHSRQARTTGSQGWRAYDGAAPTIYQIGNSEYHERAIELALQYPGIVVLHDTTLHHSRFSSFVRNGRSNAYLAELSALYGSAADEVAAELLSGRIPGDLHRFPMSERIIDGARRVVVHNDYARRQVSSVRPNATISVIPMGIPLPALVDKLDARRRLGLPESAFIVVMISHINPQKRIPILLRAIRRIVEHISETRLIIAGTPAPGLGYDRLVEMLGLRSRVDMPGYVPDPIARLLAGAADVCVNLRYPNHGETSASLLRLLGAARPVVITDAPGSHDLPEGVGLKIPVDRFEEEMLSETLYQLAVDNEFRRRSAVASRRFVEEHHTMAHMVKAYSRLLKDEYDLEMPGAALDLIAEPPLEISRPTSADQPPRASHLDRTVGSKMESLGLVEAGSIVDEVAKTIVELGMDKLPKTGYSSARTSWTKTVENGIRESLACPDCNADMTLLGTGIVCPACENSYQIRGGVPMFVEPSN